MPDSLQFVSLSFFRSKFLFRRGLKYHGGRADKFLDYEVS